MWTGQLLPIHPRPLTDELLSSWLFRLAQLHGVKLHTFTQHLLPGVAVWNRDIDKAVHPSTLQLLHARTGAPLSVLEASTLRRYEGTLFERLNPLGNSRWVLPVGVYHRTRRRTGLMYCPKCLRSDKTPHFRVHWRLSCVTVCVRHRHQLRDCCFACGAPVAFHLLDIGDKASISTRAITVCARCGSDLREDRKRQRVLSPNRLDRLGSLPTLPDRVLLENGLWVSTVSWMKTLKLLVYALTRRTLQRCLVHHVRQALRFKGPLTHVGLFRPWVFDQQTLYQRRYLLNMALWLLEGWPDRLIDTMRTCQLGITDFYKGASQPEPWVRAVIQQAGLGRVAPE